MQVTNEENINMDVNVDWKTAIKNPYINRFTKEEKLKAMLDCFLAVEKISKEELKREIDAVMQIA